MTDKPIECNKCQRIACIKYKEIKDGEETCYRMCKNCPILKEKMYEETSDTESSGSIFNSSNRYCKKCGLGREEFLITLTLGCDNCINTFKDILSSEIITQNMIPHNIQQNNNLEVFHLGNIPKKRDQQLFSKTIESLHLALTQAVELENFEDAADIRDQIKNIWRIQMQEKHNRKDDFQQVIYNFTPWINQENPIYPLNKYIIRRNISGFPFSDKTLKTDAKALCDKLQETLFSLFPEGYFFTTNELVETDIHILFEHLFIPNRERLHPEGGIFICPKNKIIAIIHLEDHLTLFLYDTDRESTTMDKQIQELDEKLQEHSPFAFSDQFGYLTSSAMYLGTGLSKEAMLHTPAVNYLNNYTNKNDKVSINGLNGENSHLHNCVIIYNKYCLGISEANIINHIDQVANDLKNHELSTRETLLTSPDKKLYNKLSKDFGLALFSKSLEFNEALEVASSIDLSISLNLIENSKKPFFFDIFFYLRRAHLTTYFSDLDISIGEKRSLFIKEKIKNLNPIF